MKFMCLVYFGPDSFAGLSDAQLTQLTDDSIEADHALDGRGKLMVAQPLQGPEAAVTVRVRNGKVSATDGPFAETKEWLGGFLLINANNMAEAVAIAEQSPVAKLGAIEVRPTLEQTHSKTGAGRPAVHHRI